MPACLSFVAVSDLSFDSRVEIVTMLELISTNDALSALGELLILEGVPIYLHKQCLIFSAPRMVECIKDDYQP